jgi:hypothetical protein
MSNTTLDLSQVDFDRILSVNPMKKFIGNFDVSKKNIQKC